MVDVADKTDTLREAIAEAVVALPPQVLASLEQGGTRKGDPIAVAELAGIMAAKRTDELIPLCHPLPLESVEVRGKLDPEGACVTFTGTCRTTGKTGVEMEALTAVSIAALTLYDMLKSAGREMSIEKVQLLAKSGGKSGNWRR